MKGKDRVKSRRRSFTFAAGLVAGVALTAGFISLVAASPSEEVSPVKAVLSTSTFPTPRI